MRHLAGKYRPAAPLHLPQRTWPDAQLTLAPRWCSVDLRDGNQALPTPMDLERRERLFDLLVAVGFKEIEVGFPSASQSDEDFVRLLIQSGRIPPDVTIQVITQAREHLIRRTFAALTGVRRAIINLYNSTSPLQRRVVFRLNRHGTIELAARAVRLIKELAAEQLPTSEILLQYAPESFTATEIEFALDVCHAVMETWQPTATAPLIFNLPATVEVHTPNVYADRIEWFRRALNNPAATVISAHCHNDRGTAVTAATLALLAGAQRVEGTLFGNAERAGMTDLVILAENLKARGITTGLNFGDMRQLIATVEYCNRQAIAALHPYAPRRNPNEHR